MPVQRSPISRQVGDINGRLGRRHVDDDDLAQLDREHGGRQAVAALDDAQAVAGLRVGADLIIGTPGQTEASALESLEAVVAQGRLYPREDLERQLDVYRRQFESPLYDAITMAIVRRVLAARFSEPEQAAGD